MNRESTTAKTILFVHYGDDGIRGSERCLLNLFAHLDRKAFTPVLWCNSQELAMAARAMGVACHATPFSLLLGWEKPKLRLFGWWQLVRAGQRLIHAYRADVVHCNSGAPCQWMHWAARWCRTPMLVHLHAHYSLRDRLTLGLYQAPLLVGVSDYVLSPFMQEGFAPEKCQIIPNGIDIEALDAVEAFSFRNTMGIPDDAIVLGYAGAMLMEKGIDHLLNVTHRLIAKGYPVHLVLLGNGRDQPTFEAMAEKLNIRDRVHFAGQQADAIAWMKGGMDIYISSAHSESFGLALAEASLAGLPVVVNQIGGVGSVIKDQVTGLLAATNNEVDLLAKIETLLTEPDLRQRLGASGRDFIRNNLTIEKYCQSFETLYHAIASDADSIPRLHKDWHLHAMYRGILSFRPNRLTRFQAQRWLEEPCHGEK
ncbi:glycosyltransferase [Photobacterium sp. CCB-ST2H9]|uniref:glycosyltransferase n=1 Tax=Photobacterium sp. CCB-ST2H9 TaxID=2912855 RepID=UPI002005E881|nr:glycosyltransferase [Photobacterium sp. CCB-ST2H9]UTM55981.1 glycosyltransferase [Photobacterium sp. CCB-ST2H9]